MLYRREGYPEEDAFVLCTVTKILNHAIFVNLDEHDKGGLVHISEVSAGRIRNIRDYVELNKKIVCKVLRVDRDRGHIDLSLRRVSAMEKRKKVESIKQEQKAEKVIEQVSKTLKREVSKVYDLITGKVFEKYPFVHLFFKDVSVGKAKIGDFVDDSKLAELLEEQVSDRFKPPRVAITGNWALVSYAPDGVEIVKKAIINIKNSGVEFLYLGGGRYQMRIEAENYKDAEQTLIEIQKKMEKSFTGGEASFSRQEE
jgi:translation initiation factor 2 subunit 1